MEKDACVEPKNGDAAVDQPKPAATAPYRYTKVTKCQLCHCLSNLDVAVN